MNRAWLAVAVITVLTVFAPSWTSSASSGRAAPVADAGPNLTAHVNDTLYFVSYSTDPDNDNLSFYWDFGDDGPVNFSKPDAEGQVVSHAFGFPGNYTITHWVVETDTPEHLTDSDTSWANILDCPGHPPIASAGPDITAEVNTEVTFKGLGSSPNEDGSITKYEWDFEGDMVWDWNSTSTGRAQHVYLVVGNYIAIFRVTDDTGRTATDTTYVNITMKANIDPVADAGEDQTVFVGQEVVFNGTGSDIDGQVVQYRWDFDGDGVWDFENETSGAVNHIYDRPGVFKAILQVMDDRGGTNRSECIVTVVETQPPIANAGGDLTVECGKIVYLDGWASSDPEGQQIAYSWDFDNDDGIQMDATGPKVYHTYGKGGNYTVTLTVTDERGMTSDDTATITVVQRAGVSLTSDPASRDLKPGEEGIFNITLSNTGNGNDTFKLLLYGENSGWGTLDRTNITLDAGASSSVLLRVSPPFDATAKSRANLTFKAVSICDPNTVAKIQLEAIITQICNITMVSERSRIEMADGKKVSFNVILTNHGNGDDSIRLQVTSPAARWITINPSTNIVRRDSMKNVSVTINVPKGAAAQTHIIVITAYAGDNSTQSSVSVVLVIWNNTGTGFITGFTTLGLAITIAIAMAIRLSQITGRKER